MANATKISRPKTKRPAIPAPTVVRLWVASGGRCEYGGCNKVLWRDDLTMKDINRSYVAHIYDVHKQTHRYDPVLSLQKATDFGNLMLLCGEHHRLIDHEAEREHTVQRLETMKATHEKRIEILTSIGEEKRSHVILYGANVGHQNALMSWEKAAHAMTPEFFPAEKPAIQLGLKNSSFSDGNDDYWRIEAAHLAQQFELVVRPRIKAVPADHFSVFAIAPQPLLMMLGSLLTDIPRADVYHLFREPADWRWKEDSSRPEFVVGRPRAITPNVALKIALSATINDDRITQVLGADVSIWTLTLPHPQHDALRSRQDLAEFRKTLRRLLDEIKTAHGEQTTLAVFPASGVAPCVEVGRMHQPKADLPMNIYDQNRLSGGFSFALTVPYQPPQGKGV